MKYVKGEGVTKVWKEEGEVGSGGNGEGWIGV